MELTITTKNLPSNPALSAYAEKRLGRVAGRLHRDTPMRLVLRKEGTRAASERFVAELTATLRGGFLVRAEERSGDLYSAIDGLTDVLARQIQRYKTRHTRRRASLTEWEATLLEQLSPAEEPAEEPEEAGEAEETVSALEDGKLVRTKTHPVAPMSVEEASAQMDLLGHAFFVFLNSDGSGINVLYRRRDGDYGLILPERAALD